jgi:hypothetical protein
MRRRLPSFAPLALAAGLCGGLLLAAPAAAAFRLEKTLPLAPGGELVVDTAGGGITVTSGAGDGARIVVTSDRDREDVEDRYTFEFSSAPGRAKVLNRRRPGFSHWFNWRGMGLHFEIQVPKRTRVDLESSGGGIRVSGLEGDARLRSSGGAVRAADLTGDVEARSSGGGVDVRRIRGDVRVSSSGGGVTVEQVVGDVEAGSSGGGVDVTSVSGDVNAESSGGGVDLADIGGRVTAESSGGPVSVVLAAEHSAGGNLSSSGGGVHVDVDRHARLSIDASSSGGSVVCDLPVLVQGKISRTSLRGELNGGGAPLVVRSSGGGIRIGPSDG